MKGGSERKHYLLGTPAMSSFLLPIQVHAQPLGGRLEEVGIIPTPPPRLLGKIKWAMSCKTFRECLEHSRCSVNVSSCCQYRM